jgi:photosystem II stability/assembly factor-like uncharacterized protein
MREDGASLVAVPAVVLVGEPLLVRGSGWPDCPTSIRVDGQLAKVAHVLEGYPAPGGVRPAGGRFAVHIATYRLQTGKHEVEAAGLRAGFAIQGRSDVGGKDPDRNRADQRGAAAFARRFGHIGYVPAGVGQARARSLQQLRTQARDRERGLMLPGIAGGVFFSRPVPGISNWTPMGPGPMIAGAAGLHPAASGRVRSVAIDPARPAYVYIGTANGGIWKSTDGGATWAAKTDDQPSMAVGALAIDPNGTDRVFAGTGEYHHANPYGGYAGQGLLYSADSGETWTQIGAATFDRAEMSRILFDPMDSANHMVLSCEIGVYETTSGGASWAPLRAGSASDVVLLSTAGVPASLQLIAGFYGEGLFTATRSGGAWSAWTSISSPAFPATFGRIVLGQSRNHPRQIWAVFSDSFGNLLAGIAKSSDGGGTWTTVALPPGPIWSTGYNLHVTVHPDSPDTVFVGTNNLYRTDTGDAPWTQVLGGPDFLHSDHHAMAFAPAAATIYAGCDGGVFRSTDGGANWEHRNRGLNTMQFYQVANHPQWAALVLGGTQDNGGAFYTGAPGWILNQWPSLSHNGIEGDIVDVAIEPLVPSRMYYALYGDIYRSDDGGRFWTSKHHVGPPAEWNFPFIVDVAIAGVCYTGGNMVERSSNAGDTWAAITSPLTGNLTTIAVHPTNSDLLYAGTSEGKVYRVQRTGPSWALADVTITDLTAAPLPAGLYISCIAVDRAGTVWVSFSSILQTERPGEFTNDHVYRLPAASVVWENRSAGLAQANPINAIAIDPEHDDVVFCGGDSSVFRWNSAGLTWELWDEGLPNAPIFHLGIQNSARLIRAASFGRGVWERPLDGPPGQLVDIYLRDDILDPARGPAPLGVPHPFAPANLVWWWQSEDIKVDAPPFQTSSRVTDEVALANHVVHRNARRGMANRFYVQVHNRGPLKATGITVRAFFADASLGLPNLPADFWTAPKPFHADPSAAFWTPIGPAIIAGDLEPCQTTVVSWNWTVPATAAGHSCLFAIATSAEDPLSVPGELVIANVVVNQNNATLKNLTIVT